MCVGRHFDSCLLLLGKQVANVVDEVLSAQGMLLCFFLCIFDWDFYEFVDYEMLYSDMVFDKSNGMLGYCKIAIVCKPC